MDFSWKPYVPVAKRREQAARLVARLALAGETLSTRHCGPGVLLPRRTGAKRGARISSATATTRADCPEAERTYATAQ